jgi:hypothetical protein
MITTMFLHQIMRQLMRHHNPPVRRSLDLSLPSTHLIRMQLHKEPEVAKDTSLAVERNRPAIFIEKDV